MKRRVVKHGPSTFIISLPLKWVKHYGVQRGDELEVLEEDNTLIISTEMKDRLMEIEHDISGLDRTSIMYTIRSFYRLGYDSVRLTFKNPTTIYQRKNKDINVLSVIHQEVNRLVGYEIMHENENFCEIKDLQDSSIKDFDQVLRRIFLLLSTTSKDFIKGAEEKNDSLLETIDEKHDTITKFVSYCLRLLNKKNHPNPKKTNYYYHVIAVLDRITDVIKYASRDIKEMPRLSKEVIGILKRIDHDLDLFHKLFYKFDNSKVTSINNTRYELEIKLRELDVSNRELIMVTSAFNILELLLDLIEARTALEF